MVGAFCLPAFYDYVPGISGFALSIMIDYEILI